MKSLPSDLRVALANWIARGITVSVQLVSIPLLTHSLGSDRYAAYAIAVSLMGWFAMADLGTGTALHNIVVEARAKKQSVGAEIGIVGIVCAMTALFGVLVLAVISPTVAPFLFARIESIDAGTATSLFFVAGTLFLCNSIGTVGNKLLYGLGHGVTANVLNAVSAVVALCLLWGATHLWTATTLLLPAFLAYALPVSLIGTAMTIALFIRWGTWRRLDLHVRLPAVLVRARGFLLIAIFTVAVLNVDYLIMSQTLAADQITTYNVLSRVFAVAILLYGGLLSATSVRWTELVTLGRWREVRRGSLVYAAYGIAAVVVLSIVLLLWPYIFELLLPGNVRILPSTLILFGTYAGIRVWTDTATVALQAANDTGVLVRWIPIQATVGFVSQISLVQILHINGIVLGLIVSFLTTVSWALPRKVAVLARS